MADPFRRPGTLCYDEFRVLPPDEVWELIDGVAYDMTPPPSARHQEALGELYLRLQAVLVDGPCEVLTAPVEVLFDTHGDVRSVVRPDIVVVCDRARVDGGRVHGAPDLAVEIIAPCTAYKDLTAKVALYETEAVAEFWIVNPEGGPLLVYRLGAGGRYDRPVVYRKGDLVGVPAAAGAVISPDAVFGG
jgi:Uma2 family endonuclease